MERKNFLTYLKGGLMLLLLSLMFVSCDKKDDTRDDEPEANPENIIGRWQKFQVEIEDNIWEPGDPDEFWIFGPDGSFKNEDGGELTTIGTYQINGNILSIFSNSLDDPDETENYSGEFYFTNGNLIYDYYELETGEKSKVLFKKM
ncbi:MAG: hypothetical protein J1E82_09160 [Muribaculaceae bacterium]|nr:hypothetical protein [Muribaculaceae bacterium]